MLQNSPLFSAQSFYNRFLIDTYFKIPHDASLIIFFHQKPVVCLRYIFTEKPPDKKPDSRKRIYSLRLLTATFAPKKGLTTSSTNRL